MGLFDSILKQGAKRLLSEVANAAIDSVTDEIKKSMNSEDEKVTVAAPKTVSVAKSVSANVPAGYESVAEEDVDVKLREVLAKEFSGYEVRENVSPATLGGTGKFMPYSYGIYENGAPKLFIMVVYNNTCRERLYRWSKEEAAKAGIPMINFVYCFENKIDYIINRLHQYL